MKKLICLMLALFYLLSVPAYCEEPLSEDAVLPESCRTWYDIAENSGASDGSLGLPLAARALDGLSNTYGVRLPDGEYTHLRLLPFDDEGVSLDEFSGGRAVREHSVYRAAWNGEEYSPFAIAADDCAIPNLTAGEGGVLRLDITGECTVNAGGEEYGCFENFDCVLITGDGTLRIENSSGINCGGRDLPLPALILDGDVTVYCDTVIAAPNADTGLSAAILGGTLCAEFLYTEGGEIINAGGHMLARHMYDVSRMTLRGGVSIIDELVSPGAEIVLSGGTGCISEQLPSGTVVEGGSGMFAAAGLASADVRCYSAALFDAEADGSPYRPTAFDESWGGIPGAEWDDLSLADIDGRYFFAGEMTFSGVSAETVLPWGALHLRLRGGNKISGNLSGSSLLFDGGGTLDVNSIGVYGFGSVHCPVFAVTGGSGVTLSGSDEFFMDSDAQSEGLFLVDDNSSFECAGDFWMRNSVLEVRSGTVHLGGSCSIEHGGIIVSGGRLIIDGSLWIGDGDVTVSGGELIMTSGDDAICLDNGTINR